MATYLSIKSKLAFFEKLATMTDAGLPMLRSLRVLAGQRSAGNAAVVAEDLAERIQGGANAEEAFSAHPGLFDEQMRAILAAAEQSGKLDEALKHIVDSLKMRLTMRQKILSGVALPACIVHAAIFILPIPQFFLGHMTMAAYLTRTLGALVMIWAVVLLGIWLVPALIKIRGLRIVTSAVVRSVPLVGKTVRNMDVHRFFYSLSMLYGAGVAIIRCLESAGRSCFFPDLRAMGYVAADAIREGENLSTSLKRSRAIPDMTLNLIDVGEMSGEMDTTLHCILKELEFEINRGLESIAFWYPKLLYFLVMLWMVGNIFTLVGV